MKKHTWLQIAIIINIAAVAAECQQTFTQIVSRENINCNATCSVLDIPELNNNPSAIIFVTPVDGARDLHPVGAYYMYLKKWSIYNIDGVAMSERARFTVQYYANPDTDRFVFTVSDRGDACIDHAGLNGVPGAAVRMFPTSPPSRGSLFNHSETKVEYNSTASRWCIASTNGNAVVPGTAYNVMFSGGGPAIVNPYAGQTIKTDPKSPVAAPGCNCVIPTSLPPNGNAGGDLGGSYPTPSVQKLQGQPISGTPPTIGQVLKWNGTAWEPAADNASAPAAATQMQTFLKNDVGPTTGINGTAFFVFPYLTHVITVTRRSRVIISAFADIKGSFCAVIDCGGSGGSLQLRINGTTWAGQSFSVPNNTFVSVEVSNYMRDLDPGTYTIDFGIQKGSHAEPFEAHGTQSSIIVIPL